VPGLALFYFRAPGLLPVLLAGRAPDGRHQMAASKAHAQSEWHLWFAWYPVIIWVETGSGVAAIRTTEVGYEQNHRRAKWRYRPASTSQSAPSRIDEDAPERGSRVWLVIIGFLIAFGPVFFFR
jgi:hypothetical protein